MGSKPKRGDSTPPEIAYVNVLTWVATNTPDEDKDRLTQFFY